TPFDGVSGVVDVDLDLTHTDLILYYELLDNIVSLDVGLNVKFFDGQLNIHERGGNNSSRTDIDDILPLLYVAPSASLPLTGLSMGLVTAWLSSSAAISTLITARARSRVALSGAADGRRRLHVEIHDHADNAAPNGMGAPLFVFPVE